ncbi:hypothetical protein [Saccharicrinis fermentans]|uniref:Uncharacterized protein n=1 Tax=Saccharicrinis fermentans DSM 9555 = JCM 21142 TaxID=869213 RepID=W7YDP1_9BACT|nr:hypothetical protein [Saccharicrinis fermentans]GAF05588.1 hypothetical protein JCM21142_104328 [Saccharicrinis fermentans DSM 9555 = JCM 21142]
MSCKHKYEFSRNESYWYYCGRNNKAFVSTSFYYCEICCEEKEVTKQTSAFPSEEYKLPDWAKAINKHRRDLDALYY